MTRDLYLAIDVGTGSLRAAVLDGNGRILSISQKEHEQIVPHFGWSEQRPMDWWTGTQGAIREAVANVENARKRIAAICCCGQMHGSILVDDAGRSTLEAVPLWNDKRTTPQVAAYIDQHGSEAGLRATGNMPAPAWPAFKLAWIRDNHPDAMARATSLLMPKDWINFKLTGKRAQDYTEASLSYLMDWKTRSWSRAQCDATRVPLSLLPQLRAPGEILGELLPEVAHDLGLPTGLPVLVGAGDYPMALLGSGVSKPGLGSDVTGTSTIITLLNEQAMIDPAMSNVLTPNGYWGSMTLLEAGGDAVRWARRAFHNNSRSYEDVSDLAARAPGGAGGIFFLPYLSGERVATKHNSRAQFFGLKAETKLEDLHRAVLEGVAFSVRRVLDTLPDGKGRPERIIAASGGAKSDLWLKIKASVYRVPYIVAEEPECGLVGAAILMSSAIGAAPDIDTAITKMVRFGAEIAPDPELADLYDRMMPIFGRLYEQSQAFYDDLDAL